MAKKLTKKEHKYKLDQIREEEWHNYALRTESFVFNQDIASIACEVEEGYYYARIYNIHKRMLALNAMAHDFAFAYVKFVPGGDLAYIRKTVFETEKKAYKYLCEVKDPKQDKLLRKFCLQEGHAYDYVQKTKEEPSKETRMAACVEGNAFKYALNIDKHASRLTRAEAKAEGYSYALEVDKGPKEITRTNCCENDPTNAKNYAFRVDKRSHPLTRETALKEGTPPWEYDLGVRIAKKHGTIAIDEWQSLMTEIGRDHPHVRNLMNAGQYKQIHDDFINAREAGDENVLVPLRQHRLKLLDGVEFENVAIKPLVQFSDFKDEKKQMEHCIYQYRNDMRASFFHLTSAIEGQTGINAPRNHATLKVENGSVQQLYAERNRSVDCPHINAAAEKIAIAFNQ